MEGMKKVILLIPILLVIGVGPTRGQDIGEPLKKLEKLLKEPTTAVPVRCILEKNKFDRV